MRLSCLKWRAFQGLSIGIKRMFIQGQDLWRVNPVLYVVITADSDQTVCYELRLFSATYCLYIKQNNALLYWDKTLQEDSWVLSRLVDDFICSSFKLSVFWVSLLGITKTLGIWVWGYPKHGDTRPKSLWPTCVAGVAMRLKSVIQ